MTPVTKTADYPKGFPKKHVHVHWFIRKGKKVLQESKKHATQFGYAIPTVEAVSYEVRREFDFVEYQLHFAAYDEGDTEYIRFEGTLADTHYKLTMDVFSCYCIPLNEDQDPPF